MEDKVLEKRCKKLLVGLGLGSPEDVRSVTPLAGGVSSDIALVDLGGEKVCVKFALPKLRVEEEWRARVERNLAEYRWLEFVAAICPRSVPKLLGRDEQSHGFVMEYVAGNDIYLWKSALLAGRPDRGEAVQVGRVLGAIHGSSTRQIDLRREFQNQDDFYSLRLEPYLVHTARKRPQARGEIEAVVKSLRQHELTLVHGDVSPKNILFRQGEPVFLDAECATVGDPCFDVSFCLNHLVLKAVHLPLSRDWLLRSVNAFWSAYAGHVTWEPPAALAERVCRLLPALLLARIDGKSPVEYLADKDRALVRSLSLELLATPAKSLTEFSERVRHYLENRDQCPE